MFLNSVFYIVKQAALFVFLLMPSMIVQAQASDAAVTSVEAAVTSASEEQQRGYSFPRWPKSEPISRERIPLAPPGPYMSSALSDFSVNGSSFERVRDRRAIKNDFSEMSMGTFSQDTPWPSHTKSPARWRPDNGYRYVESREEKRPYQGKPYNSHPPSNYNYGYKRRPMMNWPESKSGRRHPVMNAPAH